MAQIENLTQGNVTDLDRFLKRLAKTNPDLSWKFKFQQPDDEPKFEGVIPRLIRMEEKIDKLQATLIGYLDRISLLLTINS